jgi:hypothetical protein
MHGFITGVAVERARNFLGATRPVLVPACPSHLIQHEMLHTSDMCFAYNRYIPLQCSNILAPDDVLRR